MHVLPRLHARVRLEYLMAKAILLDGETYYYEDYSDKYEDANVSTDLVLEKRRTVAPLTTSERYYQHRRAIHFWLSLLAVIALTVVLGISSEDSSDAEAVLAIISGVWGVIHMSIGFGLGLDGALDKKTKHGIADSRGVRYKRESLETTPVGNDVIVTHTVRTGDRPLLWPVLGMAPTAKTKIECFDATTDEGQEAARDFVQAARQQTLPAAASPEAKALAKALKT